MTLESLLSPVLLLFLTTVAAFVVARKLSAGGAAGSNADILQRLTRLEREVQQLKQAGGHGPAEGTEGPGTTDLAAEARRIAQAEGAIPAIKHVRQQTGWGLKEAKEYVERL